MAIKLVCVHPFFQYAKGQEITDPDEVGKLLKDREHNFVKVNIPDPDPAAVPAPAPVLAAK